VDGLRAGFRAGFEGGVEAEIAFGGGGGADQNGFVGFEDVEGRGVGLGVDGDGGDAHAAEGADDAGGDGSAIGDQDFGEHWFPYLKRSNGKCK